MKGFVVYLEVALQSKHNFGATEGWFLKNIVELSLKSPLSWGLLSSPIPSFSGIRKAMKSQYEMLKLSIQCTETNYSRCTGKSSQNICSSSEGAREKGKTG